MRFLDKLKQKLSRKLIISPSLSGNFPISIQQGDIFYNDLLVQSCIGAIATEMSKLQPHHIKYGDKGAIVQDSAIERTLRRPNALMTTSDFITKVIWQLYLNFNSYILPVWSDDGSLTSLWPIPQAAYTILRDGEGKLFLRINFNGGQEWTLQYDRLIHLRRQFSVNEFYGGDSLGNPSLQGLNSALALNSKALGSIESNLAIQQGITGVIEVGSYIAESNCQRVQQDIETMMAGSKTGLIALDKGLTYKPIQRDPAVVDKDTIEYLEERVYRYFGVSQGILSGKFTKAEYEAFYQKTLEPLCISLSRAFTKALFTMRESESFGNEVRFYANSLIFMTTGQKLELVRLLGDHGGLYVNEIRELFGYAPDPSLAGVRMQSLNYVDGATGELTAYQKEKMKTDIQEGGDE